MDDIQKFEQLIIKLVQHITGITLLSPQQDFDTDTMKYKLSYNSKIFFIDMTWQQFINYRDCTQSDLIDNCIQKQQESLKKFILQLNDTRPHFSLHFS